VYINLLSFDDAEFYLTKWPKNLGTMKFSDVLYWFDGATVCGIDTKNGKMLLNPPQDTLVYPGDKVLVLAVRFFFLPSVSLTSQEDDSTYSLRKSPINVSRYEAKLEGRSCVKLKSDHLPINILFCGWRTNMEELVHQLDEFLSPCSTLTIMSPFTFQGKPDPSSGGWGSVSPLTNPDAKKRSDKLLETKFKNITLSIDYHDPQSRNHLEKLFRRQTKHFKTIVIFSDASVTVSSAESTRADSLVLVTTLFIQDTCLFCSPFFRSSLLSKCYFSQFPTLFVLLSYSFYIS
jgi:hypothetical protein